MIETAATDNCKPCGSNGCSPGLPQLHDQLNLFHSLSKSSCKQNCGASGRRHTKPHLGDSNHAAGRVLCKELELQPHRPVHSWLLRKSCKWCQRKSVHRSAPHTAHAMCGAAIPYEPSYAADGHAVLKRAASSARTWCEPAMLTSGWPKPHSKSTQTKMKYLLSLVAFSVQLVLHPLQPFRPRLQVRGVKLARSMRRMRTFGTERPGRRH